MVGRRKRVAATPVDELKQEVEAAATSFRLAPARADPEADKEVIHWECDAVSAVDDGGKNSLTYTIKGMKWYIRVRTETSERTQNEQQFSVYIYSAEKNHLDVWYADVISNVKLINRRDKAKNKSERFSYRFQHGLNNSGYASFMRMSDLLDPAQGFIHDNKIKLEVTIAVTKVHGLAKMPATVHDFASPNEPFTDVSLKVDGKKVYVSKQFLALNSPVFEALFFGRFKESKLEEIELEDLDYNQFIELLQHLYEPDTEIRPANAGTLLALADRFQMKNILKRVEHFLCTCYQYPDYALATRLRLADQYNLWEAQHSILARLQKVSDIVSLKNQRDFVPLSDTMKLLVTDLHLKLSKPKATPNP